MELSAKPLHGEIENDASPDHLTEGTNPSGGKRKTVPSLNALAILQKVTTEDVFSLSDDEICRRLYSGFLLHDMEKKIAEQKFWVCKESDKNCVLVLSKAMSITWSEDSRYWQYVDEKEECFDGVKDIPVAMLKGVTWLEVRGKFETVVLSPMTKYSVAFVVKMTTLSRSGWNNPVSVNLWLPDRSTQEHTENLRNRTKEKWFEIPIGTFVTSPDNVGELSFQLKEIAGPKAGLVIRGVLLKPLKEPIESS